MTLVNITDIQTNDDAIPELWNSRFGAIVNVINGHIDQTNLADSGVTTDKIANAAVTAVKMETQQIWQAVVYSNSWVDFDAATYFGVQYYKDSLGIVHMRGAAKNGTTTAGTTMITLPAGYRPGRALAVVVNSNNTFARIEINPDGTIKTGTGINTASVFFGNIHFRAEA